MENVMSAMKAFFEGTAGRDFVAKANEESAAALQAERQAWATELNTNQATALAAARQWEKADAKMIAAEKPLEQQLKDMQTARLQRESEYRNNNMAHDRTRDTLTHQLENSAPPEIAAAVTALRDEVAVTLSRQDSVAVRTMDGRERTTWSNFQSVNDRIAAIHPAIQTCQDLVLEALTPKALATRLDKIQSGLPKVETRPAHLRLGAA